MKPSIEATPGDQPDLLCEFLPVVNGDWVLPGPGTSVSIIIFPPLPLQGSGKRRPGLDGSFLQDSLLKGFEEKQVVSNLWGMEG